mmetsp:Transcript_971/g.1782  ORF Transcript_971/g.1782 Transcript_971/m.1782 type:complete len:201 (-) Transcript_971:593-1195(-)
MPALPHIACQTVEGPPRAPDGTLGGGAGPPRTQAQKCEVARERGAHQRVQGLAEATHGQARRHCGGAGHGRWRHSRRNSAFLFLLAGGTGRRSDRCQCDWSVGVGDLNVAIVAGISESTGMVLEFFVPVLIVVLVVVLGGGVVEIVQVLEAALGPPAERRELELGHGNPEQVEQLGLLGGEALAGLAHPVLASEVHHPIF